MEKNPFKLNADSLGKLFISRGGWVARCLAVDMRDDRAGEPEAARYLFEYRDGGFCDSLTRVAATGRREPSFPSAFDVIGVARPVIPARYWPVWARSAAFDGGHSKNGFWYSVSDPVWSTFRDHWRVEIPGNPRLMAGCERPLGWLSCEPADSLVLRPADAGTVVEYNAVQS